MASSDELLISRSRTLRSRRAFAASSFICWSLFWVWGALEGLCGIATLPMLSSTAVAPFVVPSFGDTSDSGFLVAGAVGASARRRLVLLRELESNELILLALAWLTRRDTGVLRLDRRPRPSWLACWPGEGISSI